MLLGREAPLAAVRGAWRRRQRGVLVHGAPGIGRTAFATEVTDVLRDEGADVVVVRATATARAVRLWALAALLEAAPPPGSDLAAAITGALRDRAARGRLAVIVDDAHLLDDASARALADLLDGEAGFVVATTDRADGAGPLLGHRALEPVELGPLDVEAVAALLGEHGATGVAPGTAHARSGGNPTGLLRWLSSHAEGPPVAMDAAQALDASLGRLGGPARALLDLVAVAEPLPLDAARDAAGDGADAALDELVDARLVDVVDDAFGRPQLRTLHAADARTLVDRMAPLRMRAVVRRAVAALARTDPATRTPDAVVRVAALATRVGERLPPEELQAAARLARDGDDGALALRLARAAALATGELDDVRRWVDLAYERGEVDELDQAIGRLDALAAELTEPSEPTERDRARTALAVAVAERALWRDADAHTAVSALDDAWRRVADPARRDELAALRARVLATSGRSHEALEAARPLLDHDDARVRAQAAAATGHALRRLGRPDEAVAAIDAVLARPGADDTVLVVGAQVLAAVRALALAEAGRWPDAVATAEAALARAERNDDLAGCSVNALVLAIASCGRGDVTRAGELAARALDGFEQLRQPAGVRWATAAVGVVGGLAGDDAGALSAGDRLRALPPHPADLLAGLDALARAAGDAATSPDDARATLRAAAVALAARHELGAAAACLHQLAVAGDAGTAAAMLGELDLGGDRAARLRDDHVRALASDDHAALGELADRYAAAGSGRWAVECAAAASTAAARDGDRREARRLAARAVELAASCPGLATPGLAAARLVDAGATPLTPREHDVALLAARGLPSREIASRLALSARTVDNHLARVFDKLGVRTRGELGPVLGLAPE